MGGRVINRTVHFEGEVYEKGTQEDEIDSDVVSEFGDHVWESDEDDEDTFDSEGQDLEDLNVPKLQSIAKKEGVTVRNGMKKAELVEAIEAKRAEG